MDDGQEGEDVGGGMGVGEGDNLGSIWVRAVFMRCKTHACVSIGTNEGRVLSSGVVV